MMNIIMTGEYAPGAREKEPSLQALELAGALQGTVADVAANRNFRLDLHQEEAINAIGGAG